MLFRSHQQPPEAGRGQEHMLREPPKEAACQHLNLGTVPGPRPLLVSGTSHLCLPLLLWVWFPWNSSQSHCLMILVANLGCQKHQAQSGPSSCPLFVSLLVTCLLAKWEMPYFQLLSVLILGEVPSHHSLPDSCEYLKQMKSLNSFRYFLNALLSWKRVS